MEGGGILLEMSPKKQTICWSRRNPLHSTTSSQQDEAIFKVKFFDEIIIDRNPSIEAQGIKGKNKFKEVRKPKKKAKTLKIKGKLVNLHEAWAGWKFSDATKHLACDRPIRIDLYPTACNSADERNPGIVPCSQHVRAYAVKSTKSFQ